MSEPVVKLRLMTITICICACVGGFAIADGRTQSPASHPTSAPAPTLVELKKILVEVAEGHQQGIHAVDESPSIKQTLIGILKEQKPETSSRSTVWGIVLHGAEPDDKLWLPLLESESEGVMTNASFSVATANKYRSDILSRSAFLVLTSRRYENSVRLGATLYLTQFPPGRSTDFIAGRLRAVLADKEEDAGVTFAAIKVAASLKEQALKPAILEAINRLPFDEATLQGFRSSHVN